MAISLTTGTGSLILPISGTSIRTQYGASAAPRSVTRADATAAAPRLLPVAESASPLSSSAGTTSASRLAITLDGTAFARAASAPADVFCRASPPLTAASKTAGISANTLSWRDGWTFGPRTLST